MLINNRTVPPRLGALGMEQKAGDCPTLYVAGKLLMVFVEGPGAEIRYQACGEIKAPQ